MEASQVVKQADVLMLHHLVPEEVAAGSLEPNLDYYEPRTAHGSSLSPGVHAALLARAGRLDHAVAALAMTARLDLDESLVSAAHGMHSATMGGLWQALVVGFGWNPAVARRPPRQSRMPGAWGRFASRSASAGAASASGWKRIAWISGPGPKTPTRGPGPPLSFVTTKTKDRDYGTAPTARALMQDEPCRKRDGKCDVNLWPRLRRSRSS